MAIDWNKKNLWTKYSLERIKDEYIPIRLAYENMPIKPQIIEQRLIKLERMVPSEELKEWEKQIQRGPKRGTKKQYQFCSESYFQKMEDTGEWSVPFTPFNKINRYTPRAPAWYRIGHGEVTITGEKETIAKRVLLILNNVPHMTYPILNRHLGYHIGGEMNTDTVLRRLENSGLITRIAKGEYRITLKGKEALHELESNSFYYPFRED